ncbi:MAG: transporter substrate-binding domain-containing protein, partial [Pseudomonadota bacterium]
MKNLAVLILCGFAMACSQQKATQNGGFKQIGTLEEEGKLVVLTRSTTTSYFKDKDDSPSGFEYELVESFAKAHGFKTRYIAKDSTAEVIKAIRRGEGHIAAAGLSITEDRKEFLTFSDGYKEVHQSVVCGKRQKVKSLDDLKKL